MPKLVTGVNDLLTLFPDIAREWHPTLNTMTPDQVAAHSGKTYVWICPNGHSYSMSVSERTRKDRTGGCPICARSRRKNSSKQFTGEGFDE